ncbi:MAG: phenylalanine--tRNA ligase beta subunit-related protein [Acidobacteria bacterium]|jgi:DNA/RNA-binding domain of Phe-tRNA-synthetase-like protein|nr:phenylalanine--tRNA ligase beta subunit-related protein [Acidobacteriota bacterium]
MADALPIQNLLAGRMKAGIIIYRGLSPRPDTPLSERLAAETASLRLSHGAALPPGFAFSRQLYKSFAIDPTKHRPSSEALWRRLRDRNDFPAVNPAVDLTNLLSLKFQVPYGLYDLARLVPPLVIALGEAQDQYQGIRKETLNFSGKIVLRDELGAFGNPSSDSLRASVSAASRDIMQVLFFLPGDPQQQAVLAATLAAFAEFFLWTESRSCFI